MRYCISAIGQDSHRFVSNNNSKPLMLGGVHLPEHLGLEGNSDADIILHALCNAISGLSCTPILGSITDQMCQAGITDSRAYVKKALETLHPDDQIVHVSISVECATPKISPHIKQMQLSIADILGLKQPEKTIAITATSGEGLTDFGNGKGIQVFVLINSLREIS